jgi:23S rRNA (cytidine1920-2'-O)/16S rRNA (cytidine1409-2'-O)-methyltransferase
VKRDHLWRLLVTRSLFPAKDDAVRWVMAGKVYVNGERMSNSGVRVMADAQIEIKGYDRRYVGKGGYKLEGALRDFGLAMTGKIVLDAGASTGGFTDCLLKHGAELVYSVDAGYGQLAGSLRANTRVENLERTNIGDLVPGSLSPRPNVAVADLSYLSLRTAIPIISLLVLPESSMIFLVKPLFETADSEARRTGRIRDDGEYVDILADLCEFVSATGLDLRGVTNSEITGGSGTVEFFLHVSNCPGNTERRSHSDEIQRAVDRGLALS